MRKCVYHKQLDLDTLVATRGPNFSLSRLESRVSELWKLKGACSLSRRAMLRKWGVGDDLPLNFHPATIRASVTVGPLPNVGPPEGRVFRAFGPLPNVGPPEGRVFRALSRRRAGCADGSHEGNRGLVADGAMRPVFVVVAAPILQLFAGVGKGHEPMRV